MIFLSVSHHSCVYYDISASLPAIAFPSHIITVYTDLLGIREVDSDKGEYIKIVGYNI